MPTYRGLEPVRLHRQGPWCIRSRAAKLGSKEAPVEFQDYETMGQELADLEADNILASESIVDDVKRRENVSGLDGGIGIPDVEVTGLTIEEAALLVDVAGDTEEVTFVAKKDKEPIECPRCGHFFEAV